MRHTLFIALAYVLLPAAASAQDTPRIGVVMGYPTQVGLLWNISERVAIRPEVNISKSASESTTSITIEGLPGLTPPISASTTTTSSGWQWGVGAAALIYVTKGDALRTYVSPRYAYTRISSTVERTGGSIVPAVSPSTVRSSGHNATGSIGAQYTLGTRFGLFGELGLNYTHSGETPSFAVFSLDPTTTSSNWTLGIRSGVGVILFF